jgi:CRP-like cAMP-binding protein
MVEPQVNPKLLLSLLRDVKLLKTFHEQELIQLMRLGTTMVFEAHANIVIEGEPSWGLYLLLDGTVGIFKNNKLTGDTFDIGQLRKGSCFGEMSLIDENTRSATVKALSECHLFHISKDGFNELMARSSELRLRFYDSALRTLVGRMRDLDDNFVVSQYQLWKTALRKEAA